MFPKLEELKNDATRHLDCPRYDTISIIRLGVAHAKGSRGGSAGFLKRLFGGRMISPFLRRRVTRFSVNKFEMEPTATSSNPADLHLMS